MENPFLDNSRAQRMSHPKKQNTAPRSQTSQYFP
jgi:hypothetical protein